MIFRAFRRWWQPDSIDQATVADIDQLMLDHLHRRMTRVPVFVIAIAAVIAIIAARSVPAIWATLWFVIVAAMQLFRGKHIVRLAKDQTRSSTSRLHDCVKLFFLTSGAFALAVSFFPFSMDLFRCILSLAVVGLIAGSIATLHGYPPIFFSFAVPNSLAISIGWLLSTPHALPYWIHVVLAVMMLVLLAYLLVFSRDTYHSFAINHHTQAMLQIELAKAQRINDAKSRVFASASHDLRQPLQSITLLSHKLSDKNISEYERTRVANTISVCVDLLSEELDMLLDISDLESDMSTNNPELVDVCGVIESLAELYAPVAIANDVALNIERIQSPVVKVDRVLLARLLRNLIDNALKYTFKGSVTITVNRNEDRAVIDFVDTGVGISAQDQTLIFDEFYQSGNQERDRSKGLGLGLSVVNRILPLIGGELSVKSTVDVGSRFRLMLPASDESIVVPGKPESRGMKQTSTTDVSKFLGGKRVLLIEDHELVQKATMSLFESNGAEVVLALDWRGVLQTLDTAMPDLLVSDLRLPKESGLEIATRLREQNPELPVLLISGDLSSDLAINAETAGYRVLGKPVNIATLFDEIELLFK